MAAAPNPGQPCRVGHWCSGISCWSPSTEIFFFNVHGFQTPQQYEESSLPFFWASVSLSATWNNHPCLVHIPGPPCRVSENADAQVLRKPELLNQGSSITTLNSSQRRFYLMKGPAPSSEDTSNGSHEPASPLLTTEKATSRQVRSWHKCLPEWMTREPGSQFPSSGAHTHFNS